MFDFSFNILGGLKAANVHTSSVGIILSFKLAIAVAGTVSFTGKFIFWTSCNRNLVNNILIHNVSSPYKYLP